MARAWRWEESQVLSLFCHHWHLYLRSKLTTTSLSTAPDLCLSVPLTHLWLGLTGTNHHVRT